ncbi:hypothetical protein [Fodinicola feengrottensis]|uniref:Uncharacterized protein n=1 Tax=Fodinicola feengrottensis TaxID=435914 RepID=A0ABN2FNJ2_9ACTN|nr:hypothetical protein [Fodinicola feengrottensis]
MQTFVVRVWVPGDDADRPVPAEVHGVVEHVRSGRITTFCDDEELLGFIHECVGQDLRPPEHG